MILASSSPRRAEVLGLLGVDFNVLASDIDEEALTSASHSLTAQELAISLARAKAQQAQHLTELRPILGADTVVALEGEIFGKPRDASDAFRILRKLSGLSHTVVTAVHVIGPDSALSGAISATVRMRSLDEPTISAYVATGEPLDKAGAYAIQGNGSALIEAVAGCYLTVVGLPVCLVTRLLPECGSPLATDGHEHQTWADTTVTCSRVAERIAAGSGVLVPAHPDVGRHEHVSEPGRRFRDRPGH